MFNVCIHRVADASSCTIGSSVSTDAVVQKIDQRLQFIRQVDVLDADVFRDGEADLREVHDAVDAGFHQAVRGVLGHFLGDRQDGDIQLLDAQLLHHFGHRVDGHAAEDLADDAFVDIEGGADAQIVADVEVVVQQGLAQIAHADQRHIGEPFLVERFVEEIQQIGHIIAEAPFAECAEIGKVAADRGAVHFHRLAQFRG